MLWFCFFFFLLTHLLLADSLTESLLCDRVFLSWWVTLQSSPPQSHKQKSQQQKYLNNKKGWQRKNLTYDVLIESVLDICFCNLHTSNIHIRERETVRVVTVTTANMLLALMTKCKFLLLKSKQTLEHFDYRENKCTIGWYVEIKIYILVYLEIFCTSLL